MFNCSWYNQNSASTYPNIFIYAYERKNSSELTAHPELIYNVDIDLLDCLYNSKEYRLPDANTRSDLVQYLWLMKMFHFVWSKPTWEKYKNDVTQVYQLEKDRSLGFKSSPLTTLDYE